MKTVTSKDNPALKKARKLLTRKGREENASFLAEGKKLINEASNAGFQIENVFVNAGAVARGEATSDEYSNEILLEEKLFLDLALTKTPQPFIAVVMQKEAQERNNTPGLVLILDRINDPGNAGTMIRTALASGMDEVWCTKGTVDIFSDKTIRASAGAIFHMVVRQGLAVEECIDMLRTTNTKLFVCDASGESFYDTDLRGHLAIVIGNESEGPQVQFSQAADRIVGVPMAKVSESLNAATAAAVVMYESLRQRENDPVERSKN